MQQLSNNTLLQGGKYRIKKVLGQGGFGITYLATQELLDRKVCIKEFFYKEYCERDEATSHVSLGTQSNHEIVERFLNKFLKEARTISQLEHPNIIKIHDIFKENNTAYYVMDYIEGKSLSEMVNQGGALPEAKAMEYIEQIASALYFIHQRSINHLDVKPANVMVRQSDGKVILIDFGLSKQYDAQGGQTSTTPVGISHGYAPMEQYKQGGVSTFSPETDIYALGATLYKLVTGDTPPQAMDVMNDGLPALPASLSSSVAGAIKKAIQPRKVDRFQSVDNYTWGEISPKTNYSKTQGKRIDDISGNPSYDAARHNWGSTWRMPTKFEMEELTNNCEWNWTNQRGVVGYKVTGENGNSIFLPCAERYIGTSLSNHNGTGFYLSSTPKENDDNFAYHLEIYSQYVFVGTDGGGRYFGGSVRPVTR